MKAIVLHTIRYEEGERVQQTFRSRTFDTKDAFDTFKAMMDLDTLLLRNKIERDKVHSAEFVKGGDWT